MKFNKLNFTTFALFCLGFVLIMLNFLTEWLNLAALIIFTVASILLTISFYFSSKRKNAMLTSENEEIIMELSVEDGMETYVPKEKKKSKGKEFIELTRIFSPCILSAILAVGLLLLVVFTLIRL